MFEINLKITTISNCLIGNQTESFSIGGVDQSTTIDDDGKPIIHGSSFKGAFRNIVRENAKAEYKMLKTKKYVKLLIEETLKKYVSIPKTEKIERILSDLKEKAENVKAEYIFGMEGLNGMPRLFCSDFRVSECKGRAEKDYFLIETKNCLEEKNGDVFSNPRTYRVVKPGVVFEGVIRFQNPLFCRNKEEIEYIAEIKKELKEMLIEFNTGFYRIGNSKSRGYGQIRVEILEEEEKNVHI